MAIILYQQYVNKFYSFVIRLCTDDYPLVCVLKWVVCLNLEICPWVRHVQYCLLNDTQNHCKFQ